MNAPRHNLRHIDYYDYYSRKIDELDSYIRQQARKSRAARRKIKNQTPRIYRNGLSRPTGMHDFHNLQFDPRVMRGATFSDFREKNLGPNDSTINFNKYCCIDCTGSKITPINRRKTLVGLPRMKVGGVFRPSTDDIMFEESSGRKRHKQVDNRKEMEPFIVEQLEPPKYTENGAQSDEIKAAPRKICNHVAIGTSTGSQVNINIIGTENHEDPLTPILSSIGSKVLEQSLLETFEEYELHEIRSDIRSLKQKRRNRQARERTQVEEQLFIAERTELLKVQREAELKMELEADAKVTAIVYSLHACNLVAAEAFKSLRQQRFLSGGNRDVEMFNQWLHQQMYRRLQVPRMVVNDMIKNVETDKLTDISLKTLLSEVENLELDEIEGDGSGEEDYSPSTIPPPNTASTIMYTETEEE